MKFLSISMLPMLLISTPVLAQNAPAQPLGAFDMLMQMLPMIVMMLAIFYFFVTGPQAKRQRQHEELVKSLKKGDAVILTSGLFGTVHLVETDAVQLEVARGVIQKYQLQAIAQKVG